MFFTFSGRSGSTCLCVMCCLHQQRAEKSHFWTDRQHFGWWDFMVPRCFDTVHSFCNVPAMGLNWQHLCIMFSQLTLMLLLNYRIKLHKCIYPSICMFILGMLCICKKTQNIYFCLGGRLGDEWFWAGSAFILWFSCIYFFIPFLNLLFFYSNTSCIFILMHAQ